MEKITQNKRQDSKPENMSEEQWMDYKHMSDHPGKSCSSMTGLFYSPSKEERMYYKKWTSEKDKAAANQRQIDKFIAGFITFAICVFIIIIIS